MPKPGKPGVVIDTSEFDRQVEAINATVQAMQDSVDRLQARLAAIESPPGYWDWKLAMRHYGDLHGAKLLDPATPDRLGMTYYDAASIYGRLAAYFQCPAYLKVRDEAIKIYRDDYVLAQPQPGKVAGWMIFPDGLVEHYQATGDERSKEAVLVMADHAAFSSQFEIDNWLPPIQSSREAAYNLRCKMFAKDLGGIPVGIAELREICVGHLAQWRAILDGTNTAPTNDEDVRAFMVGLTAQALIDYDHRWPDSEIRTALTQTFNLLWEKMYLPAEKTMCYTDREIPGVGDRRPSPDLNMLIAPVYAWLGQIARADLLFEGGASSAYLTGDKQFNQAARWVWDYFTWRKA